MTKYYISDPHFGHEKIISLCERPFSSSEEMDLEMLSRFNQRVGFDDELWIIGDFSCSFKAENTDYLNSIFWRLNGKKHLVIGNHDTSEVLNLPWETIHDQVEVRDEDAVFFLNHYPMMTWPGARNGACNLFGHIHNNWPGSLNSANMSVEHWNYTPATAIEILQRIKKMPSNKHWPDVEPGMVV